MFLHNNNNNNNNSSSSSNDDFTASTFLSTTMRIERKKNAIRKHESMHKTTSPPATVMFVKNWSS